MATFLDPQASTFSLEPSNTFANSTFDVLYMDGVEEPVVNINNLINMDLEESCVASAVKFLNKADDMYTDAKIKLYTSIAESTDIFVIKESFSDFFAKIKDIIDKFIKWIKSVFARFVTALMSLIGSDKYLNANKKKLDDFKAEDKFSIQGYEFSFKPDVPDNNPLFVIEDALNTLDNGTGYSSSDEQLKKINEPETALDKFRGDVIKKSEGIASADFADELFKLYRDDRTDTKEIEITPSKIMEIKRRFFNFKNDKSDLEKQIKSIESAYKKLMHNINSINNSKQSKKVTIDGKENIFTVDTYLKKVVDRIQQISSIHGIAFSAKLDAYKDMYKQDKATLYTALSKIQRPDYKRKED